MKIEKTPKKKHFDIDKAYKIGVYFGTNSTAQMLETDPGVVRQLAKKHRWLRPSHMVSTMCQSVVPESLDQFYFSGINFYARLGEPIGYEEEFLLKLMEGMSTYGDESKKIRERGLRYGVDFNTILGLKILLKMDHEEAWHLDYAFETFNCKMYHSNIS